MKSEMKIRAAAESDLPQLTEIYNHYISQTAITFDLDPFTVEQRREWLAHYHLTGRHRCLVAELGGNVLGYATSSRARAKDAYLTSVETSIYCRPEATGQRIGTTLYEALFKSLRGEDLHRAYAGITMPNDTSRRFHERFGFRALATYSEMGRKFDKYWDVLFLEKKLDI